MAIPDYQTIMTPFLQLVAANGELGTAEVIAKLADKFDLTNEEREYRSASGTNIFKNRCDWSRISLIKAGLIEKERKGFYKITVRGKEFLSTYPDRIDNKVLRIIPEFFEWDQPYAKKDSTSSVVTSLEESTPTDIIEKEFNQINNSLRNDLIEKILESSPDFFEQLIIDLLLAMGYGGSVEEAAARVGKSGDGGIDGTIKQDSLGLDIVYMQAKRYKKDNSIGQPAIRDFVGSLEDNKANKGVFVTTSYFLPSVYDHVKRSSKRIILINGEDLTKLLIKYNIGVRLENTYQIKKIDEGYFIE